MPSRAVVAGCLQVLHAGQGALPGRVTNDGAPLQRDDRPCLIKPACHLCWLQSNRRRRTASLSGCCTILADALVSVAILVDIALLHLAPHPPAHSPPPPPRRYRPTVTHFFIRLLHQKGLLLRCFSQVCCMHLLRLPRDYRDGQPWLIDLHLISLLSGSWHARDLFRCTCTRCLQNIDSLETLAGLPAKKLVAAHGNFDTARCIETGKAVPCGPAFPPCHCLSTAFPLPFHCLSSNFHCLSLTFHCLSTAFPRPFPCLSMAFPRIFTAFP